MSPYSYKTQNGLLKALAKRFYMPLDAWWLQNAKTCLIDRWGWEEKEASKFVGAYMPNRAVIF